LCSKREIFSEKAMTVISNCLFHTVAFLPDNNESQYDALKQRTFILKPVQQCTDFVQMYQKDDY
jgi:hypothetical protein